MTTHYLEEADALAHRIIVINKGKVVSEGTPTQIKSRTASRKIRCTTSLSTAQIWTIPRRHRRPADGHHHLHHRRPR